MTDHVTKEQFWDRMENVRAGFLGLENGAARPVPMSPYADAEEGVLWFITARGTDLVKALEGGPASARFVVSAQDAQIHACIDGTCAVVEDAAKLDEMWNAVASAWFEDGQRDEDVRLVRFQPRNAEVWTTPGALGFLYEVAKGNVTGEKPDMGGHANLAFAA